MTALGDTTVTVEYLVEKLQQRREENIELNSSQIATIGGGEGFMSNIFKVTFLWRQPCDLPKSAVVKIPTTGKVSGAGAMEKMGIGEEQIQFFNEKIGDETFQKFALTGHNREIRFYDWLGREPPFCAPRMYFSRTVDPEINQEGILMMEDLSDRGAAAKLEDGLSLEQVLAVTDQLASLHAYSLKLPTGWEKAFNDRSQERMKVILPFMQHIINIALSMGNFYPQRFASLKSHLKPHFSVMAIFKAFTSHMWLGLPQVMVHGDLWIANLIWAKDQNGQLTDELLSIIDFPSAHGGNVAEDLAHLLASSVSAELRRSHLDTILSHYHEKLCQKLGYERYSLAQVHRAYWAMQPATVIYTTARLPLFLNGKPEQEQEPILDRAEACLKDFLKHQETFVMSLGEKLYWYPIQMILWVYFKYMGV